jgi:tetratricopeptide (TPR) repeat protein
MVRPLTGLPVLLLGALAFSGCGDPDLWARYRAERGVWQAAQFAAGIERDPRAAAPGDLQRAARSFRRVAEQFPAATWTDAGHLRRPVARDVATLSGRAAIRAARLEEEAGNLDRALADYRMTRDAYRAVPTVALEASVARAAALERAGRGEEMATAYVEVARDFPLVDPETGAALTPVLDAPLKVARELGLQGRAAAADSTLSAAEAREVAVLRSQHGRPAAVTIWRHLARVRMEQRRVTDALAALRGALSEPDSAAEAPAMVLTMAEYCIVGGLPDSAFAYAAWAGRAFGDSLQIQALMLTARAWERRGPPDSAIAAWGEILDTRGRGGEASFLARFQRGRLLEQLGRWERARSEYRALIADDPTNELSFAALGRIVAWHAAHGEKELARIEGRRAIESLDNLIATNRDDHVLEMSRRTRAELLLDIEDWNPACTALSDLWNRYGDAESGFRAADVAEVRLRDTIRAVRLYRDLAARASGPSERRTAQDAVARLERSRG